MEHNLFRPRSFEEGKHAVVGDCAGYTMQERWDAETPSFALAILHSFFAKQTGENKYHPTLLDYGCGVGRIAKEILNQSQYAKIVGVDASQKMLEEANKYIADERFKTCSPFELEKHNEKFDICYCIYVLQHCPAIEIRDVLARIHYNLKDDGIFVYCSSDYRMAIRYDNGGFFDDRFLGVNLQEEISRFFTLVGPLFSDEELEKNPVVKNMVSGSLPHPALVFKKKPIINYFDAIPDKREEDKSESITPQIEQTKQNSLPYKDFKKILLVNRLSPGDILVMTNAIRDLHKAYPGRFQTDVNTPCDEIFENNPYITKFSQDNNLYSKAKQAVNNENGKIGVIDDVLIIDAHYPMIHRSGNCGNHFSEGHRDYLETVLDLKIPQTDLRPEIYLNQSEKTWLSPVALKCGYKEKYWIINAGSKSDFPLKQYPYYQEVVNLLKDKIKFVQIGVSSHIHKPLDNVISMINKTNVRELFRTIYHAEGVLTCVSFPMHIAAAFNKPTVVVAGAREGTRWELYPSHQFLYTNGCLPCATYDGCWKSKVEECTNKSENNNPECMELIKPEDVARAISRYYEGKVLTY